MPSPWVIRALRHEIMAQPRGAVQASRKYEGVTRNAEADLPIPARDAACCDFIAVVTSRPATAATSARTCAWHTNVAERLRLHDEGRHAPDEELPYDPAYYSDGSRV